MNFHFDQSKLLKIWQNIFTDEQFFREAGLRHYLVGYYPRDTKPIDLFDFLIKYAPSFANPKLTPTAAYCHVFKAKRLAPKEYDDAAKKLGKLVSELFLRTEEYIVQATAIQNMAQYPSDALLELYAQPALKSCFEDYWRKIQPNITNTEHTENQGFKFLAKRATAHQTYINYCIQMQYYERLNFELLETVLHDTINAQLLYFQNSIDVFEINYRSKANVNRSNVYNLDLLPQPTDPPLVALYRNLTRCLKSTDVTEKENTIEQFLILFAKYQDRFSINERFDMFNLASNCIIALTKLDRFNDHYFNLLFQLYRLRETSNCMLNNEGAMESVLYQNVVTIALLVGEIAFAKQFTTDYNEKQVSITLQQRTNAKELFQYNLGNIAFYEKRYNEVEKLLRFNETQHNILNLHAEILILKTYFEQDMLLLCGKYIETAERTSGFLLRLKQFENRISREKAVNITLYQNFSTILGTIAAWYKTTRIGLTVDFSADATEQLFTKNSPTFEERWLRAKIKMGTKG
ncbi:MAG: hypothetical protein RI894_2363 [Bacteroidota bacterium]|jgi:hypothetical protein